MSPVLCRLLSINENCGDTSPLFYVTPCTKTPDINKYVKTASKKLPILTNRTKSFLSPVLVGAVIGRPLHSTDSDMRSPQECPCAEVKTPDINKYVKNQSFFLAILTNVLKNGVFYPAKNLLQKLFGCDIIILRNKNKYVNLLLLSKG